MNKLVVKVVAALLTVWATIFAMIVKDSNWKIASAIMITILLLWIVIWSIFFVLKPKENE